MEAHNLFGEFKILIEKVAIREIERKEKDEFDRVWSNLLYEDLLDLGLQKGYEVEIRPALVEEGQSMRFTPIVDLTWKRRRNDELEKIELALQCEWSKNAELIEAAFEKLVVIESHFKVIICQQLTEQTSRELIEKLESMIVAFQSQQIVQNYLIAVWVDDHFEWKEIYCR